MSARNDIDSRLSEQSARLFDSLRGLDNRSKNNVATGIEHNEASTTSTIEGGDVSFANNRVCDNATRDATYSQVHIRNIGLIVLLQSLLTIVYYVIFGVVLPIASRNTNETFAFVTSVISGSVTTYMLIRRGSYVSSASQR